jgi:hypothetical protein
MNGERPKGAVLPREEYVEQAYLFRGLSQRVESAEPIQELLGHLREEILSTTNLPHAIDYVLAELKHVGTMATAMGKLPHYFTPFQTFLIAEAENERGRFDMGLALLILEKESQIRAEQVSPVALFFFQFEVICRNRLSYDLGLAAISRDPVYDEDWSRWLLDIRHKIGIVDIADLVYVHSQHYLQRQQQLYPSSEHDSGLVLFGVQEGRIALANRNKEPLYFFSALQRQLAYPSVPRPQRKSQADDLLPKLTRMLERFEIRLKLLEDEQRERGIDLSQFYGKHADDS